MPTAQHNALGHSRNTAPIAILLIIYYHRSELENTRPRIKSTGHLPMSSPGNLNRDNKTLPFPNVRAAPGGSGGSRLPPTNLPTLLTAFIGREELVHEIRALVKDENVRILTLTGPGGVGKTRVAFRACEKLLADFEQGVFYVSLAALSDAALVVPTIATTLGLKESGKVPLHDTLADYLGSRDLLLLLDNFEQVVDAGPEITGLLANAPGVQLMVTSRTALRLYGEYELQVPPLELPGAGKVSGEEMARSEAIQLFVARGKAVQPRFSLATANSSTIAEICRRLDGLPLAIELAAARLRLFSPQALLARMDKVLPVLSSGARDLPARQRTLRNAIDWSYNLLGAAERQVFIDLSVFAGGFTLEAARSVCVVEDGEGRDLHLQNILESLISQSLLRVRDQMDGEPRFTMLSTIREFALEKLEAEGSLGSERAHGMRHAHALYYLAIAEESQKNYAQGRNIAEWLARLDAEYDNIRAALRWALDGENSGIAARFGVGLAWYWYARGHLVEGSRWLDDVLASSVSIPAQIKASLLFNAGWLALTRNDYERTRLFSEESLALFQAMGDQLGSAKAFSNLGVVAAEQEDYSRALARFEESLTVWREIGHAQNAAALLGNLCFLALYKGDYEKAVRYGEESLEMVGDLRGSIVSIGSGINLGLAFVHAGNYARGTSLLREIELQAEQVGNKKDLALSCVYLGLAEAMQGNYAVAEPYYQRSLELSQELGNRFGVARSLLGLAAIALASGLLSRAVTLTAAARALTEASGARPVPAERDLAARNLEKARARMKEVDFALAWERGLALTEDQGIAFALRQEPAAELGQPGAKPPPLTPPATVPTVPLAPSTDQLSARELEVLRLVAEGLTNNEIASRLIVSPRTVQTHIYRIFSKLDVTTRTAASRHATEHGLIL